MSPPAVTRFVSALEARNKKRVASALDTLSTRIGFRVAPGLSERVIFRELFPLARTDDILAGFYVAEDGRANPVDVTMALARGARQCLGAFLAANVAAG